ncbi:isochorismatase family protein [Dyella halodurans]|uniref:Isochorismatase family protein n=1 Tax=Dyella halodurans TaxID=1920171 RepID=A0ABV9BZS3_9GAMM|nr:isochorismatase family protein [Dyella halodurans]
MIPLTLNADDVQVLFADLQPNLVANSRTVQPQAIAAAARVLAEIAHILNVPMTFATVPVQGKAGAVISELQGYADQHNTFERFAAGTFMQPAIEATLSSHRRKTLIISGFSTEVAVLQSALAAIQVGYTVLIAVDAIGSRSLRTESAALKHMELAGALLTSVLSVGALLAPDFSQPPGSSVLSALADLRLVD